MAYETALTVTPILSGFSGFVTNAGVDAIITLSAANTTLGAKYSDLVAKLTINTDPDSTGVGLSASAGATSINLTLSSPSVLTTPQVWSGGQIQPGSTFKNTVSSTFTVYWPPTVNPAMSNILNTTISLSSNATSIALDTTKTSNLDNFFYLTGNPDTNYQVRTTFNHSRLVSYLG
jgi:hypothetical protein